MAGKGKGDGGRGYGKGSKWELPSGSWRVQFYLDKRAHRETWPTEQAADARLEEVRRLKAAAYDIGGGLQTVQAYAEAWLEQRERSSRAARTLDDNRRTLEGYILPHLGPRRLCDVRSSDVQAALNGIEDDIRARTGGRYQGTRTAQLVASLLEQIFAAAVAQRLIPFSPLDGVQVPSYERAEVEPADDAQVASVLLAAHAAPLPALWHRRRDGPPKRLPATRAADGDHGRPRDTWPTHARPVASVDRAHGERGLGTRGGNEEG